MSVSDPTNMIEVGTLDIATSLATSACGNFAADSVQSVAVVTSTGYTNGIIAAAAPASDSTLNGYLAFYDASTLAFLGCAEAGNKPEGIASQGNKIACINEGSAPDNGSADNEGSMTMCDVTVSGGTPSFSCSTYTLSEANFVDNDWTGTVDCIYYGVDYGGNTNPCGYAPVVAIAVNNASFSFPGWFSGEQVFDTTMTSAEACQALCAARTDCDFFSYEKEITGGTEYRECYMKTAHDYSSVHCHAYDSWEFDDLFWEGHSGPATCGQWKAADAFRGTDVRLYGPTGYDPALDAEPEGGAFTDDGLYFLVGMQDNNAYAMFDVVAQEYIFMHGFGYKPMTMDASDKDNKINMKSRWGTVTDQSSCIYERMDYAGYGSICSYAPVVAIAVNNASYSFPGWFSGEEILDTTMTSATACQTLCAAYDGCSYFSYEWELQSSGTWIHECFMKEAHEEDVTIYPDTCHGFVTWGLGDTDVMHSASGNGVCPDQAPAYGMFMPDVIKSITIDGTYYFLTANEGGGRDGEDMIGYGWFADNSDAGDPDEADLEGEEIRLKDLDSYCSADGTSDDDIDCADDSELGRIKVTVFQPSDYATMAAGDNEYPANNITRPRTAYGSPVYGSYTDCIYEKYDYGGYGASQADGTSCGYAPTIAIVLNNDRAGIPSWFSGDNITDSTMTSAEACQKWCSIYDACDFFSYEWEYGYHECFLKSMYDAEDGGADCHDYVIWGFSDANWTGASGPGVCAGRGSPHFLLDLPKYVDWSVSGSHSDVCRDGTNSGTSTNPNAACGYGTGAGSPGGNFVYGGRSFTIWSWDPTKDYLDFVYDSDDIMELATMNVANGLCDGCTDSANWDMCEVTCPFNSDDAGPPAMDSRSDAKGPEPECVETGVMSDGTILAFVGLERTGGIMTFDISTPASTTFQDFLNVRNWRTSAADLSTYTDELTYNLNDGPESLIFIPATDSPIGTEMLLAATPLAARLSAYAVHKGPVRSDDGSCATTATCPYIAVADGGTGEAVFTMSDLCDMGLATGSVCGVSSTYKLTHAG